MTDGMATINTQMAAVGTRLDNLSRQQGSLVEAHLKTAANNMFGGGYGSNFMMRSLADLATFFPDSVCRRLCPDEEILHARLKMCTLLAEYLWDNKLAAALLSAIQTKLEADGGAPLGWFDQDGVHQPAVMGSYIQNCADMPLRTALSRLQQLMMAKNKEIATKIVQGCESAGIMCLIFSSSKDADSLYCRELDFDMRGRMEVGENWAYVDVGEAKSSADYSIAVPQLGRRLCLLRHVIEIITDMPRQDVRLVGRIFVPRGPAVCEDVDAQQSREATKLGYSLYLHVL